MEVRDDAPAQRTSRVIEHRHATTVRVAQDETGLLAQFAQRAVAEEFVDVDETARQREQAGTGFAPTA